jgi:hypothetical protein
MKPCAIPPRPDLDPRQWRAGRARARQRTTITTIRRIVIEGFLFPPDGFCDMPRQLRLRPQGAKAVEWLVQFFERLTLTRLQYPLGGASENTIRRDVTAILTEREGKR